MIFLNHIIIVRHYYYEPSPYFFQFEFIWFRSCNLGKCRETNNMSYYCVLKYLQINFFIACCYYTWWSPKFDWDKKKKSHFNLFLLKGKKFQKQRYKNLDIKKSLSFMLIHLKSEFMLFLVYEREVY